MNPGLKNSIILFAATILFAFISVSILFGFSDFFGMNLNNNGEMERCIFVGKTMFCKMSVIEHISLWQSMFTTMPQENLMLIALLIFLVAVIFIIKNIFAPLRLSRGEASTKQLYLKEHLDLPFFNLLKEAFSQGILNPKIYELAVL